MITSQHETKMKEKVAMKEKYSTNLQHDEKRMTTIAMITPFYNKNLKDEIVEDKDRFVHSNQHNTMQEGES